MAYKKKVKDKIAKKDGKYEIKQNKDIEIEIVDPQNAEFEVETLDMDGLDEITVTIDGKTYNVNWYNSFLIKFKDGGPINQSYKVKLPGAKALINAGKHIVILDSNSQGIEPYVYPDKNVGDDDTFELTDGDPAIGSGPP